MNKNVTAWVEALESAEYKQGRAALHLVGPDGSSSYCCLGVACEQYVKDDKADKLTVRTVTDNGVYVSYDRFSGVLPPIVYDWLGGALRMKTIIEDRLVQANDSDHVDFKGIAAMIRDNADEWFPGEVG